MDRLDFEIFKALSQNRISMWDSLDPRVSSQQIADALKVDRTTVAARLRAWTRSGFLQRTEILPNPGLFGGELAGLGVSVPDPRAKGRVIEHLGLLEGVAGCLDHVGPWLGVAIVHEAETLRTRTLKLIARISGVEEVTRVFPSRGTRPSIVPTAGDWRVLKILREAGDSALAVGAEKLGVHAKTFRRRYERLIQGGAVWSVPVYDFSRYVGATAVRLVITFDARADRRSASSSVVTALAGKMGAGVISGEGLYADAPVVEYFVHVPTVGDAETAQIVALSCEGVAEVEVIFPRTLYIMTTWFDERLERALHVHSG